MAIAHLSVTCRLLGLLLTAVAAVASIPLSVFAAQQSQAEAPAVLSRYCLGCHNQQMKDRGNVPVALDALDLSQIGRDARTFETIVRKMRAGVMPPAGAPRPGKAAHDAFLAWL